MKIWKRYAGLLLIPLGFMGLSLLWWKQGFNAARSPEPSDTTTIKTTQVDQPAPTRTASTVTTSLPTPPTASPSPKPVAKPQSTPSLTPEQKALNEQRKQAFLASRAASVDTLVEMRVAIAEGVSEINLGVSVAANVLDKQGKTLRSLAPGRTYAVTPGEGGLAIGDSNLPEMVWLQIPSSAVFYLGDRPYRGQLLLVADGGRLWAVNLVNLKSYLYSVVGSEVSASWKPHALKAQAVAARSYALTYHLKPVSPLFDLGATEYYQVYRGTETEAPSIRQAVDQTSGEYVSYRGGVVESLYAASDDIVAEAFQGHGMSQLGALSLAEQGYTYQQILANYYPGTAVGRIQQDTE